MGGFGGIFDIAATDFKDPLLVSATDGVGTKLKLASNSGIHNTVGIDLVAMCVNDLIVQGAEPLFFLDYIATARLDKEVGTSIVSGIANGCRQAGCALIGGETAEMPGMYSHGEYDLAGFTVGAVERNELIDGQSIKSSDVILGLASNGIHSNGFSLVRHIIKTSGIALDSKAPFDIRKSLGEALLTPTKIYVRSCLAAIAAGEVHGLAHITGGGLLENIPRIIPDGLSAHLKRSNWPSLPIYNWISKSGDVPTNIMQRTFNLGIGMVLIIAPESESLVTTILKEHGETVYRIGSILERADKLKIIIED